MTMRPVLLPIKVIGMLLLATRLINKQVEAFHNKIQTPAAVSPETYDDNNDDSNTVIRRIFTNELPLLDVRAEIEFSKGAFPTSVNIPILNDEQRHLVGTCYKQHGPEAAFDLGKELLLPFQEQRILAWEKFAEANPTGYLYCFRGGSRSQISQSGLKEATGIDYPLVIGGYKRMRQFLIEELENINQNTPVVMIGGRTGSGKTHLLRQLLESSHVVDLEGLANHRGSAFGAVVTPQPTQINFENNLAIEFLKLRQEQSAGTKNGCHPIFIEEEGRRIGNVNLPISMHTAMTETYPVIELETPMEERVQVCIQDYVTNMFPLFQAAYGDDDDDDDDDTVAHEAFRQVHLQSLSRIKKRVPDHNRVHMQVIQALDLFQATGDTSGFGEPVEAMLHYYDKMYDYQAGERKGEVLFRGDSKAILEWAQSEAGQQKLATVCN